MRLKDNSVSLVGVCPQIIFALTVANSIWESAGVELVITSVNDARHSLTSLHYNGCGADLRTNTVPPNQKTVTVGRLKDALGIDFDVILEGKGTDNEHCHLEWQPRRR